MTYQEYWAEIRDLAVSVTKEAREYDRDISEVLHETIGGHEWVIYTYRAQLVIAESPNCGAWEDIYGSEYPGDSVRAFWAMHADVTDHTAYDAEQEDD